MIRLRFLTCQTKLVVGMVIYGMVRGAERGGGNGCMASLVMMVRLQVAKVAVGMVGRNTMTEAGVVEAVSLQATKPS